MTPDEGQDADVNLHLSPVFGHYLQRFPSSRFVISYCRGSLAISSKLVLEVGRNNTNAYMCPPIILGVFQVSFSLLWHQEAFCSLSHFQGQEFDS